MAAWGWIVLVIAVLIVTGLVAWILASRRRSGQLRDRFGPEYHHVMRERGTRRQAEGELRERQRRREVLQLRPLSASSRDRYRSRWQEVQARFVDAPAESITQADAVVSDVMQQRGYPVSDFEQRAADISVDHPQVVERYRAAHGIALAQEAGHASTDDLREAMIHYRALFEELVSEDGGRVREAS